MGHLKRQNIPKNWPIARKGNTFAVKPLSKKGIPLLIVLRDLLKIAQTREEVKTAIQKKHLLINNRVVKDEKIGMALFDTLSILPSKIYYRLELSEKGKFELNKIKEDESNKKIAKILPLKEKSKVIIFSGKHSGKTGQIEKIILEKTQNLKAKTHPKEGHKGDFSINPSESQTKGRKMAIIDSKNEKINVLIQQILVTE